MVAYRENIRYIQHFEEVDLNEVQSRNIKIRKDGTYIITGGTGGLGLEVAKRIASQQKVNLVLIGRRSVPARELWHEIEKDGTDVRVCRIIKYVRWIEEKGSKIEIINTDISNIEAFKKELAKIKEKMGAINGIIHAAGVAGKGYLLNKDKNQWIDVIDPKIQGTWVLDKLTSEDEIDFLLCSHLLRPSLVELDKWIMLLLMLIWMLLLYIEINI